MKIRNFVLLIAIFLMGNAIFAQKATYVGATKCFMCHKDPKKGDAQGVWQDSKHAKAFTDLTTANGKKYATAAGVADATKDEKCLKCHTTPGLTEGVGCEVCHGPGSLYKAKPIMMKHEDAVAKGLLIPNEATCLKCHNTTDKTHARTHVFNYAKDLVTIKHKI